MNHREKQIVGYVICAFGFALTLWAFYPGMLSSDSIASLTEGRSGLIYDQNSPVMSFLLGLLDQVLEGTGLLLVIQLATFWTAIAIFWQTIFPESFSAGLAIVLVPFLPHLLSQLPAIWKDVGMALALLMSVALVFLAKKTGSRAALLLSPLFLFYGFAARLNAISAVLPIAIWTAAVAFSIFQVRSSNLVTVAAGLGYFIILFGCVTVFNLIVTQGRTSYPFQFVILHDLAAISIATGEPRFPGYISKGESFSMETVRSKYAPASIGPLVYQNPDRPADKPTLKVTEDANEIRELRAVWRNAILENPLAYASHRIRVFAQLIGLARSVTNQYCDVSYNPEEYRIVENPAGTVLNKYFGAFRRPVMQTFFFRGFLWLLACAYLAYRAMRSKLKGDWDLVAVLTTSSLLYVAAYIPAAPAADYRYIFWPALASIIAIIVGIKIMRSTPENVTEARAV